MFIQLLFILNSATADMEPHIVGGERAEIEKWPFIAYVVAFGEGRAATCGGSLISAQTVLTAAHCLDDLTDSKKFFFKFNYTILMGHAEFSKATMLRNVFDYETHEGYSPANSIFDIGVMFLEKPVDFSSTVKKVILMKESSPNSLKLLEVAGWGLWSTDEKHPASNSPFLKSLKQTYVPWKKCITYMQELEEIDGIICAGKLHDKDFAYSGDSGGPLIKEGTFVQVGIVSFRMEDVGLTVYTSVPHYYDWIEKTQEQMYSAYCSTDKLDLKQYSNFPVYH